MFETIFGLINKFIPDKDAARKAAVEMEKEFSKQMKLKSEIMQTEMKKEGIAGYWRPVTMLVFLFMVFVHWLMYDVVVFLRTVFDLNFYIPQDMGLTDGVLDLIKTGLMGYIGGRSFEKAVKIWKK